MSVKLIADKQKRSLMTINREINRLLSRPPRIEINPHTKAHLLIDGTFFKRTNCLILYYDSDLKYSQLYRYSTREIKEEIIKDLRLLKRFGIVIESVTADGKNAVKTALKRVYPEAVFQRCLVHIQRYAETYIRQKPKTKAGIELQETIRRINFIDSEMAMRTWLCCFSEWKRIYSNFLKEKSFDDDSHYWWYTHRNLRRVVYHIESALSDMFRYLENKSIPKDTNALESRFTNLKHKFRTHKGLKKEKRENYFAWYIYLKNQKKIY